MSPDYYLDGPERSVRVRALFDRIARRYDLINDLQSLGLHRLWKQRLVHLAQVQPNQTALDVCCGTGDIAGALAAQGAKVSGCDFSERMLAVAKTRGSAVRYLRADALALPFPGGSFDIVSIGYGLRNLADLRRGLDELLRVTKPGGRILILDFGKPPHPLWRFLYFNYLRLIVPLFGLLVCGDAAAYSYILRSLKEYPAQQGVARLLRAHGCRVEVYNFLGGAMSIHRVEKPASFREGNDVPLKSRDFLAQ